jgi:hypothetical protein
MKSTYLACSITAAFLISACGSHDPLGRATDEGSSLVSETATSTPRATSQDDVARKPSRVGHSDTVPPGEVGVGWRDQDLGGSVRSSNTFIHARIQNHTDTEQYGKLYLVASGLDGQIVKRQLSTFRLAAAASRDVPVAVRRLPIQSQQLAFVVVQAEFEGSDGHLTHVPTPPLHYTFDAQLREARFYYDNDLVHFSDANLLAEEQISPRARVVGEDGTSEEVDAAPQRQDEGFRQGPTSIRFIRKDLLPVRTPIPEAEPSATARSPSESSALSPQTVRVCSNWNTFFRDSGRGEDFMPTADWHFEPARFAFVQITNSTGSQTFWEGNLASNGCAYVPLQAGSFKLLQYTDSMTSNGRTFNTYQHQDGFSYVPTVVATFTLTQFTTEVNLRPTTNNAATNAAAALGQILVAQNTLGGLGMPAATYQVTANLGCPENPPGTDACYHWDEVRLGTTVIAGYTGAYWKFMIAHEIGHYVQDLAMGFPKADLETDVASQPLCTCNHYTQAWGNQIHCMQSREMSGGAQTEGFAHAFAVRSFNRTDQFDPKMIYYKPVKFNATSNTVFPPLSLDSWGAYPGPWMRPNCAEAGRGVEWDWMVYFFRVSTETSANYSRFQDIFNIYRRACAQGGQPSNCFGSRDITWEHLLVAARTYYGGSLTDPRYVRFQNLGSTTGVNY